MNDFNNSSSSLYTMSSIQFPMTTTSKIPLPNDLVPSPPMEYWLIFGLNVAELIGHLFLDCPISALNFYLIYGTSILHPNLKFILLCQSCCFFLRGLVRTILLICRFALNSMVFTMSEIAFAYSVPMFFRNFICHALILERLLATLWASGYEQMQGRAFTLSWFSLDIIFTLLNSYYFSTASPNIARSVNVFWQLAMSLLGIVEIMIFALLLRHNGRAYFQWTHSREGHKLSNRYQLSENIRTTRQLMPALCLYFCINFIAFLSIGLPYFDIITSPFAIVLSINFLSFVPITYLSFVVELSMIICHPFLRRDLWKLLNKLKGKFSWKQKRPTNCVSPAEPKCAVVLKKMNGEDLLENDPDETQKHFQHFRQIWNTIE